MKPITVIGALLPMLFFRSAHAWAQTDALAGPPVAFAPVTGVPIPLQSASGRFSSLNPPNRLNCPYREVTGRVVSSRLIMVKEMFCGRQGHDNVLVNVQLSNPADAVQMITGRRVDITATFKRAFEARGDSIFVADYVIAEKAAIAREDPIDHSAPPAPAFTSYMICQPPELDALARQLGSDLCVQNTIVANLTATGPALEAAARAPSKVPPEEIVSGDANAISCGLDPGVSDRHLTAIACARNSYWTWYKALRDPTFSTPAPP